MSPKQMTERLRVACQSMVDEFVPYESNLFDLVWPAYLRMLGAPFEDLQRPVQLRANERTTMLGAVGRGASQDLDTVYVLGMITNTIIEIRQQRARKGLQLADVQAIVEAQAAQIGAPESLSRSLSNAAAALVIQLLEQDQGDGTPEETTKASDRVVVPADQIVYFVWKTKTDEAPTGRYGAPEEAVSRQRTSKYDFVIDEFKDEIKILNQQPVRLHTVNRMKRIMLWLALTRIRGYIYFRDIQRYCEVDHLENEAAYQYRQQLGQLLGRQLLEQLLETGYQRSYYVKAERFSFLWIRRHENEHWSRLLR